MADQLFLSYWLRNYSDATMLRNYEKLLRLFPFSRLAQQASTFKIMAVDVSEPVVAEIPYPPPVPDRRRAGGRQGFPECRTAVLSPGDLVGPVAISTDEWKLAPARVALCCFGPEFNQSPSGAAVTEPGEPLWSRFRIQATTPPSAARSKSNLGSMPIFFRSPTLPDSPRMIESNIKSLLKLVHDLDDALPVETRRLWSESGENFAEKLHQALSAVTE